MFFPGFTLEQVQVADGSIRLRRGGSGPPLLLLHGNPQTHAMWHAVAPQLAERFTVICPDLRGYGGSLKPPATPGHAPYAKKQMARDMAEVMQHFGHARFLVGSHDRGARVAHRLALDFPDRVEKLAVLDIVPTIEHFERADMAFAMGYYHWFWFAQPHPFPEVLINAAPEAWFKAHTSREPKDDGFFHPQALADYLAAARNPDMIRGMCEDYRAAATIDLEHDRASRAAGAKVQCPLLVLWGSKGKIGQWYEPLGIWRQYCAGELGGGPVASGHYLAEEAPGEVLDRLLPFFAQPILEPINVISDSPDPAVRPIGNFAAAPFDLDGHRYASVESFWQGLKFADAADRARLAALDGARARAEGDRQGYGATVRYEGKDIAVGSPEHWALMERACRAKFERNAAARAALLATGDRPLEHVVRHDSRAIPGRVMAGIWMRIRADLRRRSGP